MTKRSILTSSLVAVALTLSACGGGSSGSSDATVPAGAVVVLGKDGNVFDAKSYTATATAGSVTIAYESKSSIAHTLLVVASDGKQVGEKLKLSASDTVIGTFTLSAGTYTLICDVPGHDNMKAELVVS
jgi:plastocyanin